MNAAYRRALVTGGGGFLGSAIVLRLLARGVEVTSLARGEYPALASEGVRIVRADLADKHAVRAAAEGQDVVFHVAAKAGVWGPRDEYVRANVTGTEHAAAAAVAAGARVFVHTSSPSVVFDGRDHLDAGPDLPYPRRYLAHYPATKARAEALVLALHGTPLASGTRFAAVALRPHLVFGPGDPHLAPRILARADAGELRIVGNGQNLVSLTYVDNAAEAHIAAADALWNGDRGHAGGRAFFVVNREPVRLWAWIDELLVARGREPVRRRVPRWLAYSAGGVLEVVHRALRRPGEPRMTRFVADQLATSHTYDLAPFERATGYRELVGMAEAMRRTFTSR